MSHGDPRLQAKPGSLHRGHIVQVRSGGPPMKVIERVTEDRVICLWFRDDGTPMAAVFYDVCLEHLPVDA